MYHLKKAFELIEEYKTHGLFGGEKEESLISQAEHILGIKFPPTYRTFLKRYGYGGLEGQQIYGVIDENFYKPGVPNGVWLVLDEREKFGLPENFIIFESTGDGYWYALDSSKPNTEGEYPVVIYGFGEDGKQHEKVNEDFGEFLLEQVTQALEDEEDKEE